MTSAQRLLLDKMLSGDIAAQLRAKGHDLTAVVDDLALVGISDEDLLAYASSDQRVLVTANVRDFASIHAVWSNHGRNHAGLIYVVNRVFPNDRSFVGAIVTALDDAIATDRLPTAGGESYLRRHSS
ncbi:MAG TPA: DUF5615 family PIN-like protein [Jatrophihabitans sp.]|nr:DUF5615 family PIN-like protein [Jatrophihabitans sp.]